jgi:hypothetical protein
MMMETILSSEESVLTRATRRNIPGDSITEHLSQFTDISTFELSWEGTTSLSLSLSIMLFDVSHFRKEKQIFLSICGFPQCEDGPVI